MTSTTFKERLANHNYTFEHKEHSNKTELSKYIWTLKDNKKDFNINWQILKRAISYTGRSKRCNLCLEEKFCILKENQNCLLNKRMEIISTRRHRKKFRVSNAIKQYTPTIVSPTHPHVSAKTHISSPIFEPCHTAR